MKNLIMNFRNWLIENRKNNIVNNIEKIKKIFNKLQIEYMFIGKGSAIMQGFTDTTQDVDIYPQKKLENNRKLVKALKKLKFNINTATELEIIRGKDFIQFEKPFQLDIVFMPDGFNNYEESKKYKIIENGFPLLNLEGIIKSKKAANRKKDILSIDELEDFLQYVKSRKNK